MVLTAAISALHQNIYTTKHTLITCTIMTIMILTVSLRYYSLEGLAFDREVGEVTIPMIAFIKGGMTLSIGRITKDYLQKITYVTIGFAPNNAHLIFLGF